uniref:Uncharacterized protein n=1 Tax=Palpitomonas bilix TaxID=652834 RepID=A0A7S3LW93_9EUKA
MEEENAFLRNELNATRERQAQMMEGFKGMMKWIMQSTGMKFTPELEQRAAQKLIAAASEDDDVLPLSDPTAPLRLAPVADDDGRDGSRKRPAGSSEAHSEVAGAGYKKSKKSSTIEEAASQTMIDDLMGLVESKGRPKSHDISALTSNALSPPISRSISRDPIALAQTLEGAPSFRDGWDGHSNGLFRTTSIGTDGLPLAPGGGSFYGLGSPTASFSQAGAMSFGGVGGELEPPNSPPLGLTRTTSLQGQQFLRTLSQHSTSQGQLLQRMEDVIERTKSGEYKYDMNEVFGDDEQPLE